MDPIKNPFSPGRAHLLRSWSDATRFLSRHRVLLARVKQKRSEKSMMLTGLRGVGKTVLLFACVLRSPDPEREELSPRDGRTRAGYQRTGDIATTLGVKVTSLGPVRAKLIKKGVIYSPAHGEMAFPVPLFDQFMIRAIPRFNA